MSKKAEHLKDWEGVEIDDGEIFKLICCDCGLTHKMVLVTDENHPGKIGMALARCERSTSARRRKPHNT